MTSTELLPTSNARSARFSATGADLSFLLARATALSNESASAALAEVGLKVRSFAVLAVVAGERRPSQRELSDLLRLDPSQIVALVDDLERRGFVERTRDQNDRRANAITATAAGDELLVRARNAAAAAEAGFLEVLSGLERAQFADALRRIAFLADERD